MNKSCKNLSERYGAYVIVVTIILAAAFFPFRSVTAQQSGATTPGGQGAATEYEQDAATANEQAELTEITLQPVSGDPGGSIRAITYDRWGRIWAGTGNDGLYVIEDDQHQKLTFNQAGLRGNIQIRALHFDSQDQLWVGTPEGLIRINGFSPDGDTGALQAEKVSLPSDNIRALAEQSDSTLWVAMFESGGGIVRLDSDGNELEHFTDGQGLLSSFVFSMTVDKEDRIWTGYLGQGIQSLDSNRVFTGYTVDNMRITALNTDYEGTVWAGADEQGSSTDRLYRFTGDAFEAVSISYTEGGSSVIPGDVQAIVGDIFQRIWAGTIDGLFRIDGNVITRYAEPEGVPDQNVRALALDPVGHKLIGTDNGLAFIEDIVPPGRPVAVEPANGTRGLQREVTLTWNPVPGAHSYRVEAQVRFQPAGSLLDTVITDTFFTLSDLDYFTEYQWRVAGINETGEGPMSFSRTFHTLLQPPDSLTATAVSSDAIALDWDDLPGAATYRVLRADTTDSLNFQSVRTGLSVSHFQDSDLVPGLPYRYRVLGRESTGHHGDTTDVILRYTLPVDPENLRVELVTDQMVELRWDLPEGEAAGYIVERRVPGFVDDFEVIGDTGDQFFRDEDIFEAPLFEYRVSAYNAEGASSGFSNIVSAMPLFNLPAITSLETEDLAAYSDTVVLSYELHNPGNDDIRLRLEYRTNPGLPFTEAPSTELNHPGFVPAEYSAELFWLSREDLPGEEISSLELRLVPVAINREDDPDGTPMTAGPIFLDNKPPEFEGLTEAVPGFGWVELAWEAATDTHEPVEYLIYAGEASVIQSVDDFDLDNPDVVTTETEGIVDGLEHGVMYRMLVRARDVLGNVDDNTVMLTATTLDAPEISNLVVSEQVNSDSTFFVFDLQLAVGDSVAFVFEWSDDNGQSWNETTRFESNGIPFTEDTTGVELLWLSGIDYADLETTSMRIRLTPDGRGGPAEGVVSDAFTVDNRPPDFAGIESVEGGFASLTVTWPEATDISLPVSYQLFVSPSGEPFDFSQPDTVVTDTAPVVIEELENGQVYQVVVRAVDALGNITGHGSEPDDILTAATRQPAVVRNFELQEDPGVPVINGPAYIDSVFATFELVLDEGDLASVQVHYSLDGGVSYETAETHDGTFTGVEATESDTVHTFEFGWHSSVDTGELESDEVVLKLVPEGRGGTGSADSTGIFVIDNKPPRFDGVATGSADSTSVLLQWTEADELSRPVTYSVYRDEGGNGFSFDENDRVAQVEDVDSFRVENLQLNQFYRFAVRATDALGNAEENNEIVSLYLIPTPEITSISEPDPDSIYTESIAFRFSMDMSEANDLEQDSVSLAFEYTWADTLWLEATVTDVSAFQELTTPLADTSVVWNTGQDLAGIESDDVRFRIVPTGRGGVGRSLTSEPFIVDNLAPRFDGIVRAFGARDDLENPAIRLSWREAEDLSEVTYQVYIRPDDGSLMDPDAEPGMTVTGDTTALISEFEGQPLQTDQQYRVMVLAADAAGNRDTDDPVIRTLFPLTPPVVTEYELAADPAADTVSVTIRIDAEAGDVVTVVPSLSIDGGEQYTEVDPGHFDPILTDLTDIDPDEPVVIRFFTRNFIDTVATDQARLQFDASGRGGAAEPLITGTFTIDNLAPVFEGLAEATGDSNHVHLKWLHADNLTPVTYHIYRIDDGERYEETPDGLRLLPGHMDDPGEPAGVVEMPDDAETGDEIETVVEDLENFTTYSFLVRAVDAVGNTDSNLVVRRAETVAFPYITGFDMPEETLVDEVTFDYHIQVPVSDTITLSPAYRSRPDESYIPITDAEGTLSEITGETTSGTVTWVVHSSIELESDEMQIRLIPEGRGGTGAAFQSPEFTFDNKPPRFNGIDSVSVASHSVTLYWRTAVDLSNDSLRYEIFQSDEVDLMSFDLENPDTVLVVTDHAGEDAFEEVTIEGLENFREYYFLVRAVDAVDNRETNEAVVTAVPMDDSRLIQFEPVVDRPAYRDSIAFRVAFEFIEGEEMELSWFYVLDGDTTSIDNDHIRRFRPEITDAATDSLMVWDLLPYFDSQEQDSLQFGFTYLMKSGNDSTVVSEAFTADHLPPRFDGIEVITVETVNVHLHWHPAEDLTGVEYLVFVRESDGQFNFEEPLAVVSDTVYVVEGLARNRAYRLLVRARDAAGNLEENNREQATDDMFPVPEILSRNDYDGWLVSDSIAFELELTVAEGDTVELVSEYQPPGQPARSLEHGELIRQMDNTGDRFSDAEQFTFVWRVRDELPVTEWEEAGVTIIVKSTVDGAESAEFFTAVIDIDTRPPRFETGSIRAGRERWDDILLQWAPAEDQSRPVTYHVYRSDDGIFEFENTDWEPDWYGTTEDTVITVDGLTAGREYHFVIRPEDNAGNKLQTTEVYDISTGYVGDYSMNGFVDSDDIMQFLKHWTRGETEMVDFYPYEGDIPHIQVIGDEEAGLNDLLVLVDMWHWSTGTRSKQLPERISSLRNNGEIDRGERIFEVPHDNRRIAVPVSIPAGSELLTWSVSGQVTGHAVIDSVTTADGGLTLRHIDSDKNILLFDHISYMEQPVQVDNRIAEQRTGDAAGVESENNKSGSERPMPDHRNSMSSAVSNSRDEENVIPAHIFSLDGLEHHFGPVKSAKRNVSAGENLMELHLDLTHVDLPDSLTFLVQTYDNDGGRFEQLLTVRLQEEMPDEFVLGNNYPNPFNNITTIRYQVPEQERVQIYIYDILGRLVYRLVDEVKEPGFHVARWEPTRFASGTYLFRMQAGNYTEVQKMMLIK